MYGEKEETCTELPLSHQFSNRFIHCRITPRLAAEYALWATQYIAVHFFHGFLPHMVTYVKSVLIAVDGECRSIIFALSIHGGSAPNT